MCALCILSPKMTSQQYRHDPGAEQQVIKKTKSPKISQPTYEIALCASRPLPMWECVLFTCDDT